MIDTHCHLDAARFDADRDEVLERAWAAGVETIVLPGIGPQNWHPLLEWPAKEPRVVVGLGIHPQFLPEMPPAGDDAALAELDSLLARGVAVAVGECGLDGPSVEGAPMERQVAILKAHFALARKHRLPLLVHCLRAHPHLQRLLKEEPIPEAGLLMHSYSGSHELTPFYVRMGCHFSFAGPVTFTDARRPLDALAKVPIERLMGETDAPDQAPHPFRGQRCEPAHVAVVLDAMAKAKGLDVAEFREATSRTARGFFRLPDRR